MCYAHTCVNAIYDKITVIKKYFFKNVIIKSDGKW